MKKKVNEKKEKEKENPDSKKNIKGKKKGNKKKDAANDDTTTNLPFDRVSPSCILSFSLIHILITSAPPFSVIQKGTTCYYSWPYTF